MYLFITNWKLENCTRYPFVGKLSVSIQSEDINSSKSSSHIVVFLLVLVEYVIPSSSSYSSSSPPTNHPSVCLSDDDLVVHLPESQWKELPISPTKASMANQERNWLSFCCSIQQSLSILQTHMVTHRVVLSEFLNLLLLYRLVCGCAEWANYFVIYFNLHMKYDFKFLIQYPFVVVFSSTFAFSITTTSAEGERENGKILHIQYLSPFTASIFILLPGFMATVSLYFPWSLHILLLAFRWKTDHHPSGQDGI